jgi:hypothetical protein
MLAAKPSLQNNFKQSKNVGDDERGQNTEEHFPD